MIYAIVGKPGKGKSYLLVRKCKEFLEHGIDVYSNIEINEKLLDLVPRRRSFFNRQRVELGRLFYWQSLADFRYIVDGIVLLDEAGAYFEPREWAKFSIEDRVKFQQHRKQKLDIWLTVQNFSRVDSVIRQLTAFLYEVQKIGSLFWLKKIDPDEVDLRKRQVLGHEWYWFDKKVANAYDTFATVNLREKSVHDFPLMKDRLKRKGVNV